MASAEQIAQAARLIQAAQRIVAFTGAGISTPSGIPDFRSPTSGLWTHADPMSVASIFGFRQNPQAFYDWVRPLARTILAAQPNAAHLALTRLEALGKLHSVITQNIDMLHHRAGNQQVYELHGHLREATCIQCFKLYSAQTILGRYMHDGVVPLCQECGGVLKPNVILFGEQLPIRQLQGAQDAAKKADLMIVIGSSLEVAPASDLPWLTKRSGGKLIIVNFEVTHLDEVADLVIHDDASLVLPAILSVYSTL
ncbi:MAG: NAD-dependent deacylase [Anaerolineae bacterium]|nr:NAD-dependent deacylase [Anaerolineae bacterium]MDW8173266.1 NAD-dependent deacylase [Anaerolineae bacterium]